MSSLHKQVAKPLMEKRRRERINNCLDQLKSLLTEVTKKADDDDDEEKEEVGIIRRILPRLESILFSY